MSIGVFIRRLIPRGLKKILRRNSKPSRASRLLSTYLPVSICVDVGASYFPHVKWMMFLNAPNTQWLAVEPNEENIEYTKHWHWPSKIFRCTTGLSREGGKQTLYITNVDTGSSLLPPEITISMKHRVAKLDYFFPVKKHEIETITLVQALSDLPDSGPIFVKLDTQGTELSILRGAQELFDSNRIVGIEMESTLLAQPIMKDSGKFWQACEYLESQGFELLHVKLIPAPTLSGRKLKNRNTYLNECDAVFALRCDVAANLPVEYRVNLMAFYITNCFYEEALSLFERDTDVAKYLEKNGCNVTELHSFLKKTA